MYSVFAWFPVVNKCFRLNDLLFDVIMLVMLLRGIINLLLSQVKYIYTALFTLLLIIK